LNSKLKLPIIIALSAVVGGGAGAGLRLAVPSDKGDSLSGGPHGEASAPNSGGAEHAKSPKRSSKENLPRKDPDGEKKGAKAEEAATFFKFSRQFVAPVVRDGKPEAMIVLDVVIEMSPEVSDSLYSSEPRLRDAVLRALLAQSGSGELQGMLNDPAMLEATRDAVLKSVQEVVGENARAVLVMDVAYQPF
jgi:flagellar protein FliL